MSARSRFCGCCCGGDSDGGGVVGVGVGLVLVLVLLLVVLVLLLLVLVVVLVLLQLLPVLSFFRGVYGCTLRTREPVSGVAFRVYCAVWLVLKTWARGWERGRKPARGVTRHRWAS